MIARDSLSVYINDFLGCAQFEDYAPNGLQIEGKSEIKRICTAVTASLQCVEAAIAHQADALLVHHGYFWKNEPAVLTGIKGRRINKLMKHDLNLFAYHLPLDAHLELGNNAAIAQGLQLKEIKSHSVGKTPNLLWSGILSSPLPVETFLTKLTNFFRQKPIWLKGSKDKITSLAWCSGGAQDLIESAALLGVDAYISGEVSERSFYQAQEYGVHYFACGHHATEREGIRLLGEHLASKFNLKHIFIDSNNPI